MVNVGGHQVEPGVPALEHGDTGANVAQCEREVEGAALLVDHGLAALCADPVTVGKHDLLHRVVEPRVHEHRPPLFLKRLLGDPGRAVRRAHG